MDALMTDEVSRKSITFDLKIAPNSFSSWAKRKTYPAADVAVEIAKKLNTTVEELVTGVTPAKWIPARVMLLAQGLAQLNDKDFETVSRITKALAMQYRPAASDSSAAWAAEPEAPYVPPEMKPLESDLRKKAQA